MENLRKEKILISGYQEEIMNGKDFDTNAKHRVKAKLHYYIHLTVYAVVNAAFVGINFYNYPQFPWSINLLLGWGIVLWLHGFTVFTGKYLKS